LPLPYTLSLHAALPISSRSRSRRRRCATRSRVWCRHEWSDASDAFGCEVRATSSSPARSEYLGRASAAARRSREAGCAELRRGRTNRMSYILFVDDEEQIRKLLSTYLTRQGHEVALATDGYEALKAIRSRMPDLVITDVSMPNM